MEQVTVKVDAKGRICIPAEIREEIGDVVTIKNSKRIPLAPGKAKGFSGRLQKANNFRAKTHRQTKICNARRDEINLENRQVIAKQNAAHKELKKIIGANRHRTGTPENWPPEKANAIWSKTE